MHLYNFFVCGPKFTRFLLSNVGGVVIDHLCFRFLIRRPVMQIFAIKSRKLSEIAPKFGRFFGPPKFSGAGLPKNCTHVIINPCLATCRLEKFHEDIPSPEVIGGAYAEV